MRVVQHIQKLLVESLGLSTMRNSIDQLYGEHHLLIPGIFAMPHRLRLVAHQQSSKMPQGFE
jgi:hypothetical protein